MSAHKKKNLCLLIFCLGIIIAPELQRALIGQDEIKISEQIGTGGYSSVYVGTWRGTKVAIKKVMYAKEHPELMEDFLAEASLMSTLRHPQVWYF